MKNRIQIRDYGINIGKLKTGHLNSLSDVKGVTVGHITLNNGEMKTGVTVILPHQGNLFKEKLIAQSHVINGFGKTIGTIQIDELGTLETPIILTNTLSVGACTQGLVNYMLEQNPEIGRTTGTVNSVVAECNDMYLNDIRSGFVKEEHVVMAIKNATMEFQEGAVGAGTGMSTFGLKGGIGSSSRVLDLDHGRYTIGVLVLSNFGRTEDFVLAGENIGIKIKETLKLKEEQQDKGSIIFVVATDLPVNDRQIKRIIKRVSVGLSRTGSYYGNGSGDLVIGFSTHKKIPHENQGLIEAQYIHESEIDLAFQGVAEATEEAILNSMVAADTTIGRDGNIRYSLRDFLVNSL